MALPKGFANPFEYFKKAVDFLKQNSWIYKEANTGFLKAGVLNHMPPEYKDYFATIENEELNQFPYVQQVLPHLIIKSLINFRLKLNNLIPLEAFDEPKEERKAVKMENLKKINVKKQHEIQRLAAVVKEILKINDSNNGDDADDDDDGGGGDKCQDKYLLIDFGSGLGYLSELLYKLNGGNILILGLESDSYRVEAAEKRVKTYMPTASNSIQYRQQFITENSKNFIAKAVEELLQFNYQPVPQQITTKMVIIGLHACADLTITSMKLFFQLSQVQHLIIMPCCYHKLQMCDNADNDATTNALKFRNFPLSESLKQVLLANDSANYAGNIRNEDFTSYLNRPFLRLACQQTLKRWRKRSPLQHHVHGGEMFLRAVAELIKLEEEEENETLVVVKRKEDKIDLSSLSAEQVESFETFSRFYALKTNTTNEYVPWLEGHRKKFEEIIQKYPNGCKLAEGLTCLQTSIQKLCENLVLYDRLCYMQETALMMNLKINVRYEKIMDEELSPRCYVLIAEKL